MLKYIWNNNASTDSKVEHNKGTTRVPGENLGGGLKSGGNIEFLCIVQKLRRELVIKFCWRKAFWLYPLFSPRDGNYSEEEGRRGNYVKLINVLILFEWNLDGKDRGNGSIVDIGTFIDHNGFSSNYAEEF